ncbi:unnamed protein product [Phaedon cochleariae]|uniref:Odorant receptor n=1 Tax=Phaedon cochleariae TaxID=80249 RepID=A0A9N9WZZ0_PHACE|nr:unnamed protein product [Phaedon cochleariae]
MIKGKLKICVEYHIQIIRLTEELFGNKHAPTPFMSISISGILVAASSICFLKYDISPHDNFRIVMALLTALVVCISFCISGQLLSDQCNEFHQQLSCSQWIYWNKQNRTSLIILLAATANPLKVSFLGLLDLNNSYMLTIFRASYSLLAVARKME